MAEDIRDARVECYAGYRGEETPRTVVIAGSRHEIAEILDRRRTLDQDSGRIRQIWRCRLADGRGLTVERREDGTWRVSPPV